MPGSFDHAAADAGRHLQGIPYTFSSVLEAHAGAAAYLVRPTEQPATSSLPHLKFASNNSLWHSHIAKNKHHSGMRITLRNVFIFEWFPRSPGLYFLSQAQHAREEAKRAIIGFKDGVVTYDPYGKQSMLDGGVGNIRLQPIRLTTSEYWFVSASDNGVCHQGFPIALPDHYYQRLIGEIRNRGAACRTVSGILRFIPRELDDLYVGYKGVQKFYLEIDDVEEPDDYKSRGLADLDVSVAISFDGIVEGRQGVYASYVTFNPMRDGALKCAVEWMGNEYVANYKGQVLTDFDQHQNHFSQATFSLKKVMSLTMSEADLRSMPKVDGTHLVERQTAIKQVVSTYNFYGGNFGAVGDGAQSTGVVQHSSTGSLLSGSWAAKLSRIGAILRLKRR